MIKILLTLIVAGAALVCIVILGGVLGLAGRLFKSGGARAQTERDEAGSAQELFRELERLEQRVESLETIIISGRRGDEGKSA
ncbi:hypothetical protein [Desulfolutivibrio sulfoxidireducens]|uniref:hypothetical protein n=1 Tax=Desulfolutivibrio sulfoxidireducens TaxID=2773299 RepID=UPI00159E9FEB|nr:hypothetical protein [Desulfolutivibrio sulfoxidireducens]QLA17225.1 hypothetical protein GD605_14575 [Desulfolutivibrio sulfoxidireducens]QLA20792.1 hypothetical protein GD604_14260 [Desulfolutivibrio sulfoxidireducens]